MEYQKFIQRKIKHIRPITSFKMIKTLCQDAIHTIASNDVEFQGMKFSKAFFYDFNNNVQDQYLGDLYILDGVEYLHQLSKSELPLVRDRHLYAFLYLDGDINAAYLNALETNPWLDDLSNRTVRLFSSRASEIKNVIQHINKTKIYTSIKEHVDVGFTPRGVWGLDYVFKWKTPHIPAKVHVTDEITLKPFEEYINYFKE